MSIKPRESAKRKPPIASDSPLAYSRAGIRNIRFERRGGRRVVVAETLAGQHVVYHAPSNCFIALDRFEQIEASK